MTTKRSLPLFWVLAVLLLVVFPAAARNENPGPGEGGPIIELNFGGDIANLNPILINDGVSADSSK